MKWTQLADCGCMVRRSAIEQWWSSWRRAAQASLMAPVCSMNAQVWNSGQVKDGGARGWEGELARVAGGLAPQWLKVRAKRGAW